MASLDPGKARIFRITHVNNVPWLLANGLHCQNSPMRDPDFVPIGSAELIAKRSHRVVKCGPGGTLGDYVPFYFTPYSIMMLNIKTGRGGAIRRDNAEIVVLTSSIHRLVDLGIPFVFFDGHAYMEESTAYDSVDDLNKIDWPLLRSRDFAYDPDDPGKKGRYQAEALIYQHLPASALLGIACYNQQVADNVANLVAAQGLQLPVKAMPGWYF